MSMSGSPCVLSAAAARVDTLTLPAPPWPGLPLPPLQAQQRHSDTTGHTPHNLSIKRMSHLYLHTTAISIKRKF